MPYAITIIPFEDSVPSVQSLCDELERVTGQSVACSAEGQECRLEVDGFDRVVFLTDADECTWSFDLNDVHDYLDAAVRVAASELGGQLREVPRGIRPWADTAQWPYRVRQWIRWAATPLFFAIELVVGVVLLPAIVVRGVLRRPHAPKP